MRATGPGVTLFPFLSIMVCVIGLLTMLLCGSILSQISTAPSDAAGAYADVERQRQATEDEVARIRKTLAEAERVRALLAALSAEKAQLTQKPADPREAERRRQAELLIRKQQLKEDLDRLDKNWASLDGRVEATGKELTKKKAEGAGSISVLPSGSREDLVPRFVECTGTGLILYPDKTIVAQGSIAGSAELQRCAREVKTNQGKKWSLVFLIRRGGVKSYDLACKVVQGIGAPYGALPVPSDRPLDLSRWVRDPEAQLLDVAEALFKQGKLAEAKDAYQRLVAQYPNTPSGRTAAQRLAEFRADPKIQKAIADAEAERRKAAAEAEAKRRKANANFEAKEACEAHLRLARNYLANNAYAQARAELEELIRQHPDSSYADEARRLLQEVKP